jgi:hypothetical protein
LRVRVPPLIPFKKDIDMGLIRDIDHSEFLVRLYRKYKCPSDYSEQQFVARLLKEYEKELNIALAEECFPNEEPEKAAL